MNLKNLLKITSVIFFFPFFLQAQSAVDFGTEVTIDLPQLTANARRATDKTATHISLPMPSGQQERIRLIYEPIGPEQPSDILTYSGKSLDSSSDLKLSLTPSGLLIVIHYLSNYYLIEPKEPSKNLYLLYNMNEVPHGSCGVSSEVREIAKLRDNIQKSIAPFPTGTELRKYRFAAAATGEMTDSIGSQTGARDKIIGIMAVANMIYEVEAAIRFELIPKSITSMSIIFTNPATDPFNPDTTFANASRAQTGFNAMNGNSTLLYSEYDIGHVFHINTGSGVGAAGQAGPGPCTNTSKAKAWTEFTTDTKGAGFDGFIAGLLVHEVGHQFSAWHTYNANGGNPGPGNTNFCTVGWDEDTAVEPGSGSTLMGYGGNCSTPTNYVLTSPNGEQRFHTKSLEQIFNTVDANTCKTTTATGNSAPVADAGADLTIPKGTPFALTGIGTDEDAGDNLSFVWDQYDIATADDRGAFGNSVNGDGGYPAVNSTTNAPLFRSRLSDVSPTRYFPNLPFVLDGTNNPQDNEGEDLPQMGRNMSFRFTVRDNASNGGGVDSDQMEVTVDGAKGPLNMTSQNTSTTLNGGMSYTVTWDVNSTNGISSNVKISLSTDGGNTFPTILVASTPNDGSQSVTIPGGIATSSSGRLKISSTHHATAEFFDINNTNLTTVPAGVTCSTYNSTDTPKNLVDNGIATSTITVPDAGMITDIDVINLNGTHSWIEDLEFRLKGPDNTVVTLITRKCGNQNDFNLSLDGESTTAISCANYTSGLTLTPDNPLSVFNGKEASGDWVLSIDDNFLQDTGTLDGWGLQICRSGCPNNITLVSPVDDISSGTVDHEAVIAIDASNSISGGTVRYNAGQEININNGFTISNGDFEALIDGCGGS